MQHPPPPFISSLVFLCLKKHSFVLLSDHQFNDISPHLCILWHNYPSIHLDYCMYSSICPEPQINWARKKKKKKKATIVWSIWNSELNHLPWAQRHCPHQQHCLDTVYTWLHSSAHCRHTKSSWNILQPISRLWNVQGEHYLVILAMWHISLQWYKDCILAW